MHILSTRLTAAIAGIACLVASAGPVSSQTGTQREAKAHVHGVAELSVVVDGDQLLVDLRSPLGDIVGIEREPKTAAERATADKATALLNDSANIVVPAPAADCVASRPSVVLPFDAKPAAGDHGHDHDHDVKPAHMDLEASYVFTCRKIASLDQVAITAFRTFPEIKTVDAVFLGPRTQLSRELKAASPVFKLK